MLTSWDICCLVLAVQPLPLLSAHPAKPTSLMPASLLVPLLLFHLMIGSWPEGEGSMVPAQVAGRGDVPRLGGCQLVSAWLYNLALISLTYYLQKQGKGRNGGECLQGSGSMGLLHLSCQF